MLTGLSTPHRKNTDAFFFKEYLGCRTRKEEQLEWGVGLFKGSCGFPASTFHSAGRMSPVDPGGTWRRKLSVRCTKKRPCAGRCVSQRTPGTGHPTPTERGSCALEITVAVLVMTKANQESPKVMAAFKPGSMTAGRIQSLAAVRRRSVSGGQPQARPWFPVL